MTRDTYLAAHYAQIRGRRGVQKAVGAIRHDILIAYWHIVHDNTEYRELGPDWMQRRRGVDAQQKRLVAQLEKLGLKVTIEPEQPAA
jgi:hypothetical protein